MHEVIIGLMFSALIPIVVFLVYKPSLNLFFKLLLASIFLSILFDFITTSAAIAFKNNLAFVCLYCIINTFLVTLIWQKVPFFSSNLKLLIRNVGSALIAIMILINIYFKFTIEAVYVLSSLNVIFWLSLSLLYYYQKIKLSSYTPLLKDPYFITATAFLLFSLSTIMVIAAQIQFEGQPGIEYTWVLRQSFYFIYNIIIAYAFYVLFKIQRLQ
jgi:hypothetical protein